MPLRTYSNGISTWKGLPNCSMICLLRTAERYPFIVWAFKPSWPRAAAKLHNFFSSVGRERDQPWCKNLCTYVAPLHRLTWWKVPGSIGDSAEPADPCFLSPVFGGNQCVDQFFCYWRWNSRCLWCQTEKERHIIS